MKVKYTPCRQLFKSRTSGQKMMYGTFGSVFTSMSPEVRDYTLNEIADGGYETVAEYISDIMTENFFNRRK